MMKKKVIDKYLAGNIILKESEDVGALVLGDCNSAFEGTILKHNKIKTIISIGIQALPPKDKISEEIAHKFYDLHDNKSQKISTDLFDQVIQIIQNGRKNGGVLIHCYAGVSRSSTFVIAYVMSKFLMSFDHAKQFVKKHRSCIHPGDGFIRHLQAYQKVIQIRQKERLAKLNASKEKIENISTFSLEKREKRGVRGAVKSASDLSPDKNKSITSQINQIKCVESIQIEQKKEQEDCHETKRVQMEENPLKSGHENQLKSQIMLENTVEKLKNKKSIEKYENFIKPLSHKEIQKQIKKIENKLTKQSKESKELKKQQKMDKKIISISNIPLQKEQPLNQKDKKVKSIYFTKTKVM